MPRKKRIWYPGAIYHVTSRGNRRNVIYRSGADDIMFLQRLIQVKELCPFTIHALCLMTNHFHMLVETEDVPISKIMHRLLRYYAAEFNFKYRQTGHVFENRFVGRLVKNERYFLEVSRYIHLNPVKAGMVKEPAAYKYSSYSLFVSEKQSRKADTADKMIAELVDTSRILSMFECDPNGLFHDYLQEQYNDDLAELFHGSSRERYKAFVEGKMDHAEHEAQIMKDVGENELWMPF